MLKELRISNLAIIGDLKVSFGSGLNVLTGETGAGKSIIVDALCLALGDRAQADMLRSGEKEATVQAFFEPDSEITFPDIGIDLSEDIVLRRALSASGKSRAYINDTIVTLQTLSEVGKVLVDIHSQHEHQRLLKPEQQRSMLDAYGQLQDELAIVASLFEEVQSLKAAMKRLDTNAKERDYRIDLLKFQVNEIDKASLKKGEKKALEEERNILSHLSRLNELTETSYSLLYSGDNSCSEQISAVLSRLKEMHAIDSGVEEALRNVESALPLIDDAALALRSFKEKYNTDPERLETVEDRLELIKKLEKKYGEDIEGILNYAAVATEELSTLMSTDESLASLRTDLLIKEEALLQAAMLLSEKRTQTARKLESRLIANLKDLSFSHPEFRIDVHQDKNQDGNNIIHAHGLDGVEFLFSANPGEPLKPLLRIASGGELSRLMLALNSIVAEDEGLPVLIFDEVDAGIGGRTAESVGKKLREISRRHQLLCITHLPQIASLGDVHLKIEKIAADERVTVDVRQIEGKERLNEISRMLSGTYTKTSLKHAEELLARDK